MITFALPTYLGAARNGTAEPLGTWPNLVTLARTVVAVGLGAAAIARNDVAMLGLAYAVYWAGDIADGWLARRLGQETRTGAVFDIVGDRACTVLLCAGLVAARPGAWLVGAVFLVSFAVVDTMLSLSFLHWDLLGPNDFHRVDRTVWLVNWSPLAKAVNTAGVVGLTVFGVYRVALLLAVVVLVVKVASGLRVMRLVAGPGLHVTSP